MKIVVMSDTHLNRVTDEFKGICARYCNDADLIIHLGDWVSTSVLDHLSQYPLEAVAGNTDNHLIHDMLPAKKVIRADGRRLGRTPEGEWVNEIEGADFYAEPRGGDAARVERRVDRVGGDASGRVSR